MKKLSALLLFSITFLAGCTETPTVTSLQQENAMLKQEISNSQQVKTEEPAKNTTQPAQQATEKYTPPAETYKPKTQPVEESNPVKSKFEPPTDSYDNDDNYRSSWCCKYCSKGKACGDSCINVNYTCHKGPGCACDS